MNFTEKLKLIFCSEVIKKSNNIFFNMFIKLDPLLKLCFDRANEET